MEQEETDELIDNGNKKKVVVVPGYKFVCFISLLLFIVINILVLSITYVHGGVPVVVDLRYPFGNCWNGSCARPFKWVYKSDLSEVYTPGEIQFITEGTCKIEPDLCCPGALSAGGRLVYHADRCHSHLLKPETQAIQKDRIPPNYNLQFQPSDDEQGALFDFADALELLPSGTRIGMIGDSVMHQTVNGLLCGLSRTGRYNISNERYLRSTVNWQIGTAERLEFHVQSSTDSYDIIFHREYLPSVTGLTLWEICASRIDILVFNFGSHYSPGISMETGSTSIAQAIEEHCVRRKIQVIYLGSMSQHFLFPNGIYENDHRLHKQKFAEYMNTDNITAFEPLPDDLFYIGCGPIVWKNPEVYYDYRNYQMLRAFHARGFEIAMTPWGGKTTGCSFLKPYLFYIPMGEVTMDRYDLHYGECTHVCSTQSLWNVVSDGLYLAFRQMSMKWCSLRYARQHSVKKRVEPTFSENETTSAGNHFQIFGLVEAGIYKP